MANPFLARPRRWLRLAVGCAVLLLVGVAAGLVIQTALSPKPRPHHGVPAAVPLPGAATGIPATGTPTGSATTGSVEPPDLVRGRPLVAGMYVGYPHSPLGAVSAAAEYMTQIGSTLDPNRSAAVLRLTVDPSYPDGPKDFAQGTKEARQELGLSVSGPVPTGASVTVSPVEYQVEDRTADQVTVLLLANYTIMLPRQGVQNRVSVFPLRMRWSHDDWKLLKPSPSVDYSGFVAQPGTQDATVKGWLAITR